MAGNVLDYNNNVGIKVGVGCHNKVKVNRVKVEVIRIEPQTAKSKSYDFC